MTIVLEETKVVNQFGYEAGFGKGEAESNDLWLLKPPLYLDIDVWSICSLGGQKFQKSVWA